MLTLNDGRSELWQWDTGRKLTVDADCTQVHFSNKFFGRSVDVDVFDGTAAIPDVLLQVDNELIAWAFVGTPENGYTKISKVFKVNKRNKPADYVFTPPEQTTLEEIKEKIEYLESIQDPDAIKNAVDDYLANNPIKVEEKDPTVPEWAKQPNPPDVKIPDKLPNPHSITFTGAVNASYDGSDPVEITIPDSGGNVDQSVSVFSGRTASFYGDSFTEVNHHYTKGYHQWLKEILGLASYKNYGVSGYKISDVFNKVNSITDTSDIIFVMVGVNDVQFDVPLGSLAGLEDGTVYGNLNSLCAKLREKYPTKLLTFITPAEQKRYPGTIGVSMYDVAKAVKEVCEKHSIVVYDNFVNSEICTTNLSYWTTDNCHWNDSAHEMVGKNLSRFVVNTFRYIYSDTSGGESAKTLNSITATFAQGDTIIYDTDTLDSLKQYLTVTANYSDGSTETVTGYTLSGTLAEGTSTVTASYGGKSATFTVNVTKNNESGGGDTDVEDDRYIGKTFKMTGGNEGVFNATAIVEVDSDCAAGKTAALTLIGHDADNLESGSIYAMAVFGDNTGVCGNSAYTGVASSETSINTYVTDGVVTVNASYTLTTVTSKYLKIPAPLKYVSTANPASFVIDQISATVDGKEKEIVDFGSFFSDETCTFE